MTGPTVSINGGLLARHQPIRKISDEVVKAVDSSMTCQAGPVVIVQSCFRVGQISTKLHKKQNQGKFVSRASASTDLRHAQKSAPLLNTKRSFGQKATSRLARVNFAVKKPFTHWRRPVSYSKTGASSDLVTDPRFPMPFGPDVDLPDPLRSNPPFALINSRSKLARTSSQKDLQSPKEFAGNSPHLSAVSEASSRQERQRPGSQSCSEPSGTSENSNEALQVPDTLRGNSNERWQEERRHLNAALRELISERVFLAGEVASLRRDSKATEDTLRALWNLVQPNLSGLDGVMSTKDIRMAVDRMSGEGIQMKPSGNSGFASDPESHRRSVASLEGELAQQAIMLEQYKKMETTGRKMLHDFTNDNRKMQARLSESEDSKQNLKARLEATERRLRRLEDLVLQSTRIRLAEMQSEIPSRNFSRRI